MHRYLLRLIDPEANYEHKLQIIACVIQIMAEKHNEIFLEDFINNGFEPDLVFDALEKLRNKKIIDYETNHDRVFVDLLRNNKPDNH